MHREGDREERKNEETNERTNDKEKHVRKIEKNMYKIQCRLNQMGIIQRKALHLHRFILDTAHYFFS